MKILKHSKLKGILFDLDGVLVNSYEAWFRLFNDTLKHFGYKTVTKREFDGEWGKSTKEDVKYFMPERTIKEVREYYSRRFPNFVHLVKITPQAKRTLLALRKIGYRLGCVTNSHLDITEQLMAKAGIKKYFEVTICADEVKKPKPAPDMLKKAMKRMGVKPSETLLIGDTKTDFIAGKKARCLTIGYKMKAKYSIRSLKDLSKLLKKDR